MSPRRRNWVLGAGVAVAAAAGGAGLALWRQAARNNMEDAPLWQMTFDQPGGQPLALAGLRGHWLVLNFWATWCPPCVREMPALERFHRDFASRGWRVVGLAVDQREPVREFLARTPVTFDIGLAGSGGIGLSRRLGNERGSLPFTVLFDRDGSLQRRHLGETSYALLAQWATDAA